jgi:hypothetical protein
VFALRGYGKTLKKNKRKKDVFWLLVLEVSVHAQVLSCSGVYGKAEHHGRGKLLAS